MKEKGGGGERRKTKRPEFRRDLYKSIIALLFAIEEVNRDPQLLPNITLGFHMFDSCFSDASSLRTTFHAISGYENSVPNYKCGQQPRVPAVIGDPVSSSAVAMARVLGLWKVPQVSYAAALPSLSNKLEFPSFLRTSVKIDSQSYALVELCKKFGWNWIGLLISSTDYGNQGGAALKTEATKNGICIAFYETITLKSNPNRMPVIIENVRRSTATVIVLFASPPELLHYLKRVQFVNTAGEEVSVDDNGDMNDYFDILNWRLERSNTGQYVKVGTFSNDISGGYKLTINDSIIQWARGKVPLSVCSDSCPPGYRKAPQKGQPVCCFNCVLCPDGMISNQTNSIDCLDCPEDQWPNSQRSKCIPKVIEFLSYEDPLGLVLSSFSVGCSLITVMVLCVYLKFQDTAVVKANNRNLSYLLLLSLTLCFLCSLTFIGCPSKVTCTIRQTIFGVTFTLCISCILAKTIIVLIAFKATKPDSSLRRWIGSKTTVMVVVISTCAQVILIMVWLFISPPFLEHHFNTAADKILLECNEGSIVMFYSMLGYLGFLALLSFGVAFLARSLPDNFNEAKYITFSMLTFLSVWVSFIPAYLSSKGKYIVAVEVFAILFSSFGLLCCIFCPKCYIILLRPSMNTREHLMASKKA
ncbi:vomeronasal type-2 receptor 26-like [Rhinophrynus dorsalis]